MVICDRHAGLLRRRPGNVARVMSERSTAKKTGSTRLSVAGKSRQHTLGSPVHCSGVGLHGGAPVAMTLHPAPADHGIVFRRTDTGAAEPLVPALWDRVVETRH